MKLAFCLFNYFPYGGLQRDFLRIAHACLARGHVIHVYTMRWEGPRPANLEIHIVSVQGWQNHTRARAFAAHIAAICQTAGYDRVIGFNKMPHLDIYYAADVCYQAKIVAKGRWFYRLLPRYRQLCAFERAVFAKDQPTKVLLISPDEKQRFMDYYQTPPDRFVLLPPGISKDRIASFHGLSVREAVRSRFHLRPDEHLLLFVGSGFKTKGLDRVIKGLAALPISERLRTHLFVVGEDNAVSFKRLAKRLQVEERVNFLGGRPDVPDFLLAADLLVHPAYHENTGTVLLEAIVAGLPVLTVAACGYASYVSKAKAGVVLAEPFQQAQFNHTLQSMLLSSKRSQWQQNGLAFAKQADLYSLVERAADAIEAEIQ